MLCFSGDFSGSVYENMMYFQQLCFFSSVFLCVFFFFLSCRFKGMQGTVRSGLITVLKTVRSDRGSHGSLHLSSRTVLDAKRTAKMSGSRFFRSDRTVRSGFHNHGPESKKDLFLFQSGRIMSLLTFIRCMFLMFQL